MDIIYVGLTLLILLASLGYVELCDRLMEETQ
jgi:hypothetical protein